MTVTYGGLFEGYGGLTMGAQMVEPGELLWYAEIDEGACKILARHHPDVPNLGDVTKVKWEDVPRVKRVTAGFPCQDVSGAGKQAGLHQGTRSGLWHETLRAIDTLRPELVLLENVRGLMNARGDEPTDDLLHAWAERDAATQLLAWVETRITAANKRGNHDLARDLQARRGRLVGLRRRAVARTRRADARIVRAIGTVLGTLADIGYDAVWHGFRAADIGAPHGRWRIFILAYPSGDTRRIIDGDHDAAAHT